MKKIHFILLSLVAVLGLQQMASAQDLITYELSPEGIGYSKVITPPDPNGVYNIYLQTFVTGEKTAVQKSIPSDIVLVLDVSSSMINNNVTSYTYSEVGTSNTEWSYNNYGNNTYYYLDTDGEYCQVRRTNERINGGNTQRRYNLYYTKTSTGNTRYYLSNSSGITTTRPTDIADAGTTIWTGQLYTQTSSTVTRLQALKDAVGVFLDTIHDNDINDKNGNPRSTPLGNKVSIVKFSGPYVGGADSLTPGNHGGGTNDPTTEVFKGWTLTTDEDVVNALKADVNNIQTGQGTSIDYGMAKAKLLLNALPAIDNDNPRSRTVVVFTDGSPYRNATGEVMSEGAIANAAINTANDIKQMLAYTTTVDGVTTNVYTKVFTVGMLGTQPTGNVLAVLDRSSSNYENATSTTTGSKISTAYYFLAEDAESLTAAFANIGASAGGASYELDGETTAVVDVVSKSFMLPPNADVNSIEVFTADCIGKYVGGDYNGLLQFEDEEDWDEGRPQGISVDLSADKQKVTVTDFEFSDNWCGSETSAQGLTTYRGKKVILKIPIQMATTAVGGKDLGTNAEGSGIIVNGDNILQFTSPEVSLPVNIWIRKEGLLEGESAKFTIQRAVKPDSWYEEGFEYPTASNDPRYNGLTWEDVSSIFVTRHAGQAQNGVNAPVTKAVGLPSVNSSDKEFIYRIVENTDWSWSYTSTAPAIYTSDLLETNPFVFSNSKKTNIDVEVRHAESKATNTFKDGNFVVDGQVVKVVTSTHVSYDDSKTNTRGSSSSSSSSGSTETP